LSDGGETTVLDFGRVEGYAVFGEFEAFLDQGGQFADAAALFAEDFLGVCCSDDCEGMEVSILYGGGVLWLLFLGVYCAFSLPR
jgi:hypothetical protein